MWQYCSYHMIILHGSRSIFRPIFIKWIRASKWADCLICSSLLTGHCSNWFHTKICLSIIMITMMKNIWPDKDLFISFAYNHPCQQKQISIILYLRVVNSGKNCQGYKRIYDTVHFLSQDLCIWCWQISSESLWQSLAGHRSCGHSI